MSFIVLLFSCFLFGSNEYLSRRPELFTSYFVSAKINAFPKPGKLASPLFNHLPTGDPRFLNSNSQKLKFVLFFSTFWKWVKTEEHVYLPEGIEGPKLEENHYFHESKASLKVIIAGHGFGIFKNTLKSTKFLKL